MLNLLAKISPDAHKSSSKIGQILSINSKYLAFVTDLTVIEVVDYSKKDNKVKIAILYANKLNEIEITKFYLEP